MASISARWMASPILRRSSAGLPLRSEIRTSGMRGFQPPVEPCEQPADCLVALSMGGFDDLLPQLGVTTPFRQRDGLHGCPLRPADGDDACRPPADDWRRAARKVW